jgi:hypothetical protein
MGRDKGKDMKRLLYRGIAFCLFLAVNSQLSAFLAYAQGVASDELIKNAQAYDGKPVVFEGEAVGEVMRRGAHAWVNLHDGKNAIGIWMPLSFTGDIGYTGSYKAKGDWLEATGIFRKSCPEHGGDLDIHAHSLRKVNVGRPLVQRMNPGKKNFALVLAGALCLVLILRQLSLNFLKSSRG